MPASASAPVKLYLSSIWAGDILDQKIMDGMLVTTFRGSDRYKGGVLRCEPATGADQPEAGVVVRLGQAFEDLGTWSSACRAGTYTAQDTSEINTERTPKPYGIQDRTEENHQPPR